MLTDTHCHLNHEQFADDLEQVVADAQQAGVGAIVVAGTDVADSEQAVELADRYASIYAAVGIHPHTARDYGADALRHIRVLASHPKVVAIGEIGLDYHYDFSPQAEQRLAFVGQLELAQELGLPAVIHCRDAYPDVLDIASDLGPGGSGATMHCWNGDRAQAERALELGLYLGFGGMLTFKNAEGLRQLAAGIPTDRIVLETDAPYLAPTPHRGRRNQPAYVRRIAEEIARLRGVTVEEVGHATTANARRLFPRLGAQASAPAPNPGCSEAAT